MVTPSRPKRPQNRIAISTKALARRWRKRLDQTTEEIEAAVKKVGNNAETAKADTTSAARYVRH
jgi:hypothetical protein